MIPSNYRENRASEWHTRICSCNIYTFFSSKFESNLRETDRIFAIQLWTLWPNTSLSLTVSLSKGESATYHPLFKIFSILHSK